MSKYSRIESRTAVLTRDNPEGQYSCMRLNTTVRGHNTGLISKHPFHDTAKEIFHQFGIISRNLAPAKKNTYTV